MKKCPHCDELINDNEIKCHVCGEHLHQQHKSSPPPLPQIANSSNISSLSNKSKQSSKSPNALMIFIIIVLALSLAIAIYYIMLSKENENKSNDKLNGMQLSENLYENNLNEDRYSLQKEIENVIKKVYSCYVNDDLSRNVLNYFSEEYNSLNDKIDELENESGYLILDWDPLIDAQDFYRFKYSLKSINVISNDKAKATIRYDLFGDDRCQTKNLTLIRENGSWKIDTFDGDSYSDFKQWMQNTVAKYAAPVSSCTYARPVDLGLSVDWANINIGADSEESYGDYFAWTEADVATQYWGNSWRLPTKAELEELKNYCSWTWTNIQGIYGYRVTGPNGNSIFLPAAGYFDGSSLMSGNSFGSYMSSDGNSSVCYRLSFNSTRSNVRTDHSYQRRTVRPVSTN